MEARITSAAELRREIAARNRIYACGRRHVESYGSDPVIVYEPQGEAHGNFFGPSYAAIAANPEWARRFNKVHAQQRSLPRSVEDPRRKWRELDSSMSSDALLMNIFCAPCVAESAAVRRMMGVDSAEPPVFGWKARVPLANGLFDRTEVDMRWGDLLVEAKLTESDFQMRKTETVEAYRDFAAVFDRDLLPRVEVIVSRRKSAVEFHEDYSQEWEDSAGLSAEEARAIAAEFQTGLVAASEQAAPREVRYVSYQLIRNVLAAYASGTSFCVIHDERRPDLREAWFEVMAAARSAELRTRLKVLTWQELAAVLPADLQVFLDAKYGVVDSSAQGENRNHGD
jgi:hypothetical protein